MSKTIFIISLIFGFAVQANMAQESLKIVSPNEFEFVHCVPLQTDSTQDVNHYVIDLRNEKQHRLFSEIAEKNTLAVNLNNLQLIEENLLANTLPEFDVSWVSEKQKLIFQLIILDTDGTLLEGNLIENNDKIQVRCFEVTSEN